MTKPLNAFNKVSDFFHAILGFVSGIVNLIEYGWVASIAIMLLFMLYESIEAETPRESYHDLIEFLCGLALSIPLLHLF